MIIEITVTTVRIIDSFVCVVMAGSALRRHSVMKMC